MTKNSKTHNEKTGFNCNTPKNSERVLENIKSEKRPTKPNSILGDANQRNKTKVTP